MNAWLPVKSEQATSGPIGSSINISCNGRHVDINVKASHINGKTLQHFFLPHINKGTTSEGASRVQLILFVRIVALISKDLNSHLL